MRTAAKAIRTQDAALVLARRILRNLLEPAILAHGTVLFMNRAAWELHGLDEPEDAGINLQRLGRLVAIADISGAPIALPVWPLARAAAGECFERETVRLSRRGGNYHRVLAYSATRIEDPDEGGALTLVNVRDIHADQAGAEEIREARAWVRRLSAQLLRLQDQERRRIARELHDGTVQVLSGLAMNLSLLAASPMNTGSKESRLITESLDLAKQCLAELRGISYLLHPPGLDELGLVSALRSWLDGFGGRTGIAIDVDLDDPGRLPPETETTLFRIAQEALANVHRHSGSETAFIRLRHNETRVRLEISDAGRGLPANVLRSGPNGVQRLGVGILGMRERARQLGGTLEIRCSDRGTTVSVTLPLLSEQ